MSAVSRIGLGTAQFGSRYGISNRAGRPDEREIAAILVRAFEAGVDIIDTATAYGDAEEIVGRHWPRSRAPRVVTKVPPVQAAVIEARDGQRWLDAIAASRDRLRIDKVHAVLAHHAADFVKPGWQHLVDALAQAKADSLTAYIGASIYDVGQLTLIESRFCPEIVQLPLNALDRRPLETGVLARLKSAGAEIHVRSVFLQGLLLMAPDDLPDFFAPVRGEIAALHRRWQEQGMSVLAGCLAFALRQKEVDAVIVGVNRRAEFDEIVAAVESASHVTAEADMPPAIDAAFLDPSRWPAFNA